MKLKNSIPMALPSQAPGTPSSQAFKNSDLPMEVPVIDDEEPFFDVVKKLYKYTNPHNSDRTWQLIVFLAM